MRDIRVSKDELLAILNQNRDKHRALYDEACANFLKAAEKKLRELLRNVNKGVIDALHVGLPVPEDHTRDYDRVIKMISLETREEMELSETDVRCYVMDEWAWRRAWAANTASYTGSAAEYAD